MSFIAAWEACRNFDEHTRMIGRPPLLTKTTKDLAKREINYPLGVTGGAIALVSAALVSCGWGVEDFRGFFVPEDGARYGEAAREWELVAETLQAVSADNAEWSGEAATQFSADVETLLALVGNVQDSHQQMEGLVLSQARAVASARDGLIAILTVLASLFTYFLATRAAAASNPFFLMVQMYIARFAATASILSAMSFVSAAGANSVQKAKAAQQCVASYTAVTDAANGIASTGSTTESETEVAGVVPSAEGRGASGSEPASSAEKADEQVSGARGLTRDRVGDRQGGATGSAGTAADADAPVSAGQARRADDLAPVAAVGINTPAAVGGKRASAQPNRLTATVTQLMAGAGQPGGLSAQRIVSIIQQRHDVSSGAAAPRDTANGGQAPVNAPADPAPHTHRTGTAVPVRNT